MSSVHGHNDEIEALLPAYALEALDEAERRSVEGHLAGCPECRRLLSEYREVADSLLEVGGPIEPPASLRARLIERTAPLPVEPSGLQRLTALPWARLAAGLALALLLFLNLQLLLQTRELRQNQEQLAAQLRASNTAMSLVADPQARTTELTQDNIQASFVYEPGRRVAVLYAWGLEALPREKAYQTWLVTPEGDTVDAGVFTVPPDSPFVWVLIRSDEPLQNFEAYGISVEPAEGSQWPTDEFLLGSDL